jgi:hypothetical protein
MGEMKYDDNDIKWIKARNKRSNPYLLSPRDQICPCNKN